MRILGVDYDVYGCRTLDRDGPRPRSAGGNPRHDGQRPCVQLHRPGDGAESRGFDERGRVPHHRVQRSGASDRNCTCASEIPRERGGHREIVSREPHRSCTDDIRPITDMRVNLPHDDIRR